MGRNLTLKITFSAVAAALTFVATVFIQVPSVDGGYTNLSDAIIFLTAALLGPVPAMLAGGLGTFFADLYVYPATMFYSLVIHGLEGLFCGLLLKLIHSKCRNSKLEPLLGGAAMALCGFVYGGNVFSCKMAVLRHLGKRAGKSAPQSDSGGLVRRFGGRGCLHREASLAA